MVTTGAFLQYLETLSLLRNLLNSLVRWPLDLPAEYLQLCLASFGLRLFSLLMARRVGVNFDQRYVTAKRWC